MSVELGGTVAFIFCFRIELYKSPQKIILEKKSGRNEKGTTQMSCRKRIPSRKNGERKGHRGGVHMLCVGTDHIL